MDACTRIPTALSIAGSDPTGGAGMQADLRVFQCHGVHGAGVITALTVQDSTAVHQVLPAFPSVVLDQLRVLLRDFQPHSIKTGMLATDDVLRNVLLGLETLPAEVPLVVDPVLLASDGTPLLERRAWPNLRGLIERATLVTPNLAEAEALSGRDVSSKQGTEAAARTFVSEMGAGAALITGGHRSGNPDDLLALREEHGVTLRWLEAERIPGAAPHGTGCALSSAVSAQLALGLALPDAVLEARAFVRRSLRGTAALGKGAPFLVYT